jgi:titin
MDDIPGQIPITHIWFYDGGFMLYAFSPANTILLTGGIRDIGAVTRSNEIYLNIDVGGPLGSYPFHSFDVAYRWRMFGSLRYLGGWQVFFKDGPGILEISGQRFANMAIMAGTLKSFGASFRSDAGIYVYPGASYVSLGNDKIGVLSGDGSVAIGRGLKLTIGGNDDSTFNGVISDEDAPGTYGSLEKVGTGTFTLAGANTYRGQTWISDGTLRLGTVNALWNGVNVSISSTATLDANNFDVAIHNLSGDGRVILGSGHLNVEQGMYRGVISGVNGSLSVGGDLWLGGTSTYTGETAITRGTLRLQADNALPAASPVTIAADAILDLVGTYPEFRSVNATIGSLSGFGSVNLRAGILNTGGNNRDTTFDGTISGTGGSLNKRGTGRMVLTSTNTYTWLTTVFGGTLLVNGRQPNSPVYVEAGATLAGTGTVGPSTVAGTLSPGASGPGILNSGSAEFWPSSTFRVRLNGTTAGSNYDQLAVSGTVQLDDRLPQLAVSLGFASAVGDQFTILTSTDGITGTFSGLPEGATLTVSGEDFRIHYTATAVTLTHIGGDMVVRTVNDGGPGSLRQAILDADGHPGSNVIGLRLGSGPQTIALTSPLPAITTPITLDGTTQPGYAGVPLIELNGAGAGPGAIGLTLQGGHSLVKGLVINRFDGAGIYLQTNGGDIVQGNFIGTDQTGRIARGNGIGVQIAGVQGCLIGTDGDGVNDAAERNLISGNRGVGVLIRAFAQQNVVAGNYIGTDVTGTVALGNGGGVEIQDGSLNRIGTSGGEVDNAAERNLISGNRSGGVGIWSPTSPAGSVQNVVAGNFIGTDWTGTRALGNEGAGVLIGHTGPGNRIGTNGDGVGDAAERNVISANALYAGIWIGDADQTVVAGNYIGTDATGTQALGNVAMGILVDSSGVLISRNVISGNGRVSSQAGIAINGNNNVVAGNYIGTDATGSMALGNTGGGVFVNATALNNRIGTRLDFPDPAERNIISGNNGFGIRLGGAVTNNGSVVAGNYIGTNVDGSMALGNTQDGIIIEYSGTIIGGSGAGNVIAGNGRYGVYLFGRYGPVTGTRVQGNFIGTNADRAHLGNASDGIALAGAFDSTLGGTAAGTGNVIAYNGRDGVRVEGGTGNAIQGNAIFGHPTGLGIRLVSNGNHNQAFPVLTSATSGGGTTTIQGTLTSTANATFTLEFFANTVCHPSGFGEGEQFLGSWTVTTDANGQADFAAVLAGEVPVGQFVAATATAPNQDTSSFSACVVVAGQGGAGGGGAGGNGTRPAEPDLTREALWLSSISPSAPWDLATAAGPQSTPAQNDLPATDRRLSRNEVDRLFGTRDLIRMEDQPFLGLQLGHAENQHWLGPRVRASLLNHEPDLLDGVERGR